MNFEEWLIKAFKDKGLISQDCSMSNEKIVECIESGRKPCDYCKGSKEKEPLCSSPIVE